MQFVWYHETISWGGVIRFKMVDIDKCQWKLHAVCFIHPFIIHDVTLKSSRKVNLHKLDILIKFVLMKLSIPFGSAQLLLKICEQPVWDILPFLSTIYYRLILMGPSRVIPELYSWGISKNFQSSAPSQYSPTNKRYPWVQANYLQRKKKLMDLINCGQMASILVRVSTCSLDQSDAQSMN